MKKSVLYILVLAMMLALVSCGDAEGGKDTSFVGADWKANLTVGEDGYPAALEEGSLLIEVHHIDTTGLNGAMNLYTKSYYKEGAEHSPNSGESIELNGSKYYFVGGSETEGDVEYTENGAKVTVSVNGKVWVELERVSGTEYKVTTCNDGVNSKLPVGTVFSAK